MASTETSTFWKRLEELSAFKGEVSTYWARYAEALAHAASGRVVLLLAGGGSAAGPWRELARVGALESGALPFPTEVVEQMAEAAKKGGVAEATVANGDHAVIGMRMQTGREDEVGLALILTDALPAFESTARHERLRLLADRPSGDLARRREAAARSDLEHTSLALEISNRLSAHRKYVPAAMAWVNELAAALKCSRVALSWSTGRHLRLVAVSQMEKFSKKVGLVRDLEAVMDEAYAQDDEVLWPAEAGSLVIAREHGQFSTQKGIGHLVSVPLRVDGNPVGVVHLQRQEEAFEARELNLLRVLADQATPWLWQLRRTGVWRERIRGWAAKLVGVQHTGAKLVAVASLLAILALTLIPVNYRVDAPFILRSSEQALLPAPFEGYIGKVMAEIGDTVAVGDVLLELDDAAIRQREAGLLADIERFRGEADRAESAGRFAERRIALAQGQQAEAELAIARHQIEQSKVRSPIAGRVVEGRHQERLGSVVDPGEILFRVAKLETVFAEIDIDERDVQEVQAGSLGSLAFTSRPETTFPIAVERVDPAGTAKADGNVFMARGALSEESQDWWRPGMTGLAKIDAGERSLFWIGTHRLADYLRLNVWWW